MKKLLTFFALLMLSVVAWAQNPKLSYQAVVRDNLNKLVVDNSVNVTINILKPDNSSQYEQTFSNVPTNRNGLVSLLIGGNENWDNVAWLNAKIRVAVEIPSANCTVVDTTDVSASPLAIFAQHVNHNDIPQSDWNETDVNSCTFILNKPSIRDTIQNQLSDPNSISNHIVDTIVDNHIKAANDSLVSNRELDDRHFLTSDSTVIKTMRDSIQINKNAIANNATNIATNTTNISTNADNIATNTSDIATLKNTNFDTIYKKSEQDAKLHLTKDYGFKIFNWGNLPQNEAAVYILNQSGNDVTKTSALTAKDGENPSMTAFLVGKDPEMGQAAVIGTVNQSGNPVVMGALGYSKDGLYAAVMANGPIAFDNGHYATDINTTDALPATPSNHTLVTEATLKGSIQNLENASHTHNNMDILNATTATYTIADSTKLDGIAAGAEVNVQADWNETDNSKDAFIQNKPTIPAAANNATITIKKNNTEVGSFTVNTNENKEINITVPTTVSQLEGAGDYAKLAKSNTFTGTNDFTGGTTKVASGFTFGTTTTETCDNIAVNACDLLTVFDSIQRQFTALRAEIKGLRDSLQDLRGAREPEFSEMNFERAETSLTATATFNDHGATITEYNFCISTSEDMSNATCQTTTEATYNFTELQPGTQYYVTVAATNLKGTTTSDAQDVQTVHARPVLGEPTATPVSNTEIKVEGELTDMGGSTPTTVTVYAYTNSDYSDAEPIHGTDSIITSVPKNYKVNVGGLAKGTTYYLAVIANNGDKQDTIKTSATTLNITVKVSSDQETDTILTGSNVDVTVKYTATVSGIEAAEEGYSWKVNDTDSTSNSNVLTVHYTEASAYTVVCEYNGATDTVVTVLVPCDTITFVPNGGFGEMTNQAVGRGKATKLTKNLFTHPGEWGFVGWNTVADGTGTSYADEANITVSGNDTLYAQWLTYCPGIVRNNETGNGRIESVKDYDGNAYAVVKIGEQCWMKENLKSTKYGNGNDILDYVSPDNNTDNVGHYGYLYTWDAVMNDAPTCETNPSTVQGICPDGWHVPSPAEWVQMIDTVKKTIGYMGSTCNGCAQALSSAIWTKYGAGDCAASGVSFIKNRSGFSALPAGYHYTSCSEFGTDVYFWTSNTNCFYAWSYDAANTYSTTISNYSFSVRCLRDESLSAVTKTDSAAHSLTVSADCALENVTTATVCAYTDADCTTDAVCAETVAYTSSPISATINGLNANTSYYVKVTVTTADGSVSKIGGPFKTAMPTMDTITFVPNGGTIGSMDKLIIERGVETPLTPNAFTHEGNWEFIGWNTAYDGNGTSYNDVANITTNGNVTLHAQWHTWCYGLVANNESGDNRIDSVKDGEGNWYDVVQIQNVCWLKEDLRTKKYANGYDINYTTDDESGDAFPTETGAIVYEYTICDNICPNGWKFADAENWSILNSYAATTYNCGLKALCSTSGWGTGSSSSCAPYDDVNNNRTGISVSPHFYESGTTAWYLTNKSNGYGQIFVKGQSTNSTQFIHYGAVRCVRTQSCPEEPVEPIPGSDDPTNACSGQTQVSDICGNTYQTVAIGTQCWMAENLRTIKKTSGVSLNKNILIYLQETSGYDDLDGNIYYCVNDINDICPAGWHTPTVDEWNTLFTFVGSQADYQCDGSSSNYAKALASKSGWNTSTETCAIGNDLTQNNKTYFNILPLDDEISSMGAVFWGLSSDDMKIINFEKTSTRAEKLNYKLPYGYYAASVRCVRDVTN